MLAVRTNRLTKNYGKYAGIEDVDLTVSAGDIFGLIGPKGAGKTTVLKILMNYIFPSGGDAKVLGLDVVRDAREIKRTVCFVPTEPSYYPRMRARKIIATTAKFHQKYDRERIDDLMQYFEIDNLKADDMSSVDKKMVAFAAALACEPDLLLVDDITKNLETSMKSRLFALLEQENQKGMTILLTSEVSEDIEGLCTDFAFMREGRILEDVAGEQAPSSRKLINLTARGYDLAAFMAIGADVIEEHDGLLRLVYDGDLETLARLVKTMDVVDLRIDHEDLQSRFMSLYKGGGQA